MTPIRIDPDENQVRHILKVACIAGERVLDIGCGDGELTCQYAEGAARVVGMDPDFSDVRLAVGERQQAQLQHVHFLAARAQALPFPSGYFDTAIFTSSL